MSQDSKPADAPETTAPQGSEAQTQGEQQTANPSVEVSDSVRSYLKGLGLENVNATEELVKVAEAGMKQKESVSRLSLEKEEILARLASQGKDTSEPEVTPEEPAQPAPEQTPASVPTPKETQDVIGVSSNDLFDLSRMITTEFKEISQEAQDGSLFKELRQLGYFTAKGIDKKAVYDYLAKKNAQAAELRELREFKQKYGQPDPSNAPVYNPVPGANLKEGEMNAEAAHAIVLAGDHKNPRYADAVAFLQQQALK